MTPGTGSSPPVLSPCADGWKTTPVCTIKTPDPRGGRGEWECVCQDIQEALPRLIAQGAPEELLCWCADGLEPVCGARFTRRARRVELPHSEIELALDRGVLLGGGKEVPLCEVEMELKAGTEEDLEFYARYMAERYDLHPETRSKFQRAKALSEEV